MDALNIKAVVHLSGVSPHTLRAWEKRYKAVTPQRTKTGRRSYSFADVEKLKLLSSLIHLGYAIGGIANFTIPKLQGLLKQTPNTQAFSAKKNAQDGEHTFAHDIIDALQQFRLDTLNAKLNFARMSLSTRAFVFDVISPLMKKVGELVQKNQFTIVQEHALSAVVRDQLGQIYQSLFSSHSSHSGKSKIVLATPEGDLHEFGILLSAVLASSYQFPTHYLGPNLPAEDLAAASKELHAAIVIIGTTPPSLEKGKQSLNQFLSKLDSSLPASTQLWVGGEGVAQRTMRKFDREILFLNSLNELDQTLQNTR